MAYPLFDNRNLLVFRAIIYEKDSFLPHIPADIYAKEQDRTVENSNYAHALAGKAAYLIAEIGSNHNGSFLRARRLIIAAAASGADAVKFQLFTLPTLIQPENFEKALSLGSDSKWEKGFRALEFALAWLPRLKRLADRLGVDFLATPFDEKSLAAYIQIQPAAIKIASGDITHHALLRRIAGAGLPKILSTGAANDAEIERALGILGKKDTALLDCVMRYPADGAEYSRIRIERLQKYAPVTGISDHSEGLLAAAEAVRAGATIVEKHFTTDRKQKGADHAMSAEPDTLRALKAIMGEALHVREAGQTEASDSAERVYARRAIYARHPIRSGDVFSEQNCIALRPAIADYVPASAWEGLEGRAAARDYSEGMGISFAELSKE